MNYPFKNRLYDLKADGGSASTHDCGFSCTSTERDASGFVEQMRFWRKWLGFVRRKSFQTDPRAVPLVPIHILSTIKGAELELSQKFQRVTLNMIPAAYYLGHLHYTTDISFQNEDCVLMQHMNRSVWSKSARSSCVFFADIQYCVLSVVLIAITRHELFTSLCVSFKRLLMMSGMESRQVVWRVWDFVWQTVKACLCALLKLNWQVTS